VPSAYVSIEQAGRPPEEDEEEGVGCMVRKDKITRDKDNTDTLPPSGRTPRQMLKEILTRHLDHRVDAEYASFLEEQSACYRGAVRVSAGRLQHTTLMPHGKTMT
jgi:hypothetical protein